MASSTFFQELVEVEPGAADVLVASEVRRERAGSSHRADSLRDVSFLIVEQGFLVIRRALTKQRWVIICDAGAGLLLPAPEPGETLDALVDARVTLVSEAAYLELLAHPHVVYSAVRRAEIRTPPAAGLDCELRQRSAC